MSDPTSEEATYADGVLPPSRYIEKVSLLTGEVLSQEILPRQLLVHHHRDRHILDVYARFLMSRAIQKTGDANLVQQRMKSVRQFGKKAAEWMASMLPSQPATISKRLLGLKDREYYFRYKRSTLSKAEIEERARELCDQATARMANLLDSDAPGLVVLLTGGTGFLGKELMAQAADDSYIREMIVVIRERVIKDRKTGAVVRVESPAERGAALLSQLWLTDHPARNKFRFVAGDIEQPLLGLAPAEVKRLERELTHTIHCAASVSFDDTYDNSFRANVLGCLNALQFSDRMRKAKGNRFITHLGIETSYIHGRQTRLTAREDRIVFPRNFFNNYYELTKALASIETDRFMLSEGLPVVQLCPSIVVGHARTGNNRGDTKVVNAPVNTFGRAKQALENTKGTWLERSKANILGQLACVFPGDPSAELNLIPVDRVAAGILAALRKPHAIGHRIHLATDNRLTSASIQKIAREEIETAVKLAEPTLHRTVTLPVLTKVLTALDQPRLAKGLETLGTIFGGYSEWGQPVHEVGRDIELLGLPLPRPNTEHVFRMLCRHNRYVQNFGQVRDLDEISRRERVWQSFIFDLERRVGQTVGSLSAVAFRKALAEEFDLETFTWPKAVAPTAEA